MFNELTDCEMQMIDGGRKRYTGVMEFVEDAVIGGMVFELIRYGAKVATEKLGKVFVESLKEPVGTGLYTRIK